MVSMDIQQCTVHFLAGLFTSFANPFCPSQYEDPMGASFKLTHEGFVQQYLNEFEDLANHIIGLPSPFLLSCFISGLTPEIHWEVQVYQPLTVVQVAGLTRFHEEKKRQRRSEKTMM